MHRPIDGTQRLARHLWRMCFALFIASMSVFLARQHLFPAILRTTGVLYVLSFSPLLLMIFWLIRIRVANAFKRWIHAQA
jgi:cell division protein FtsW (lipid II flippase)